MPKLNKLLNNSPILFNFDKWTHSQVYFTVKIRKNVALFVAALSIHNYKYFEKLYSLTTVCHNVWLKKTQNPLKIIFSLNYLKNNAKYYATPKIYSFLPIVIKNIYQLTPPQEKQYCNYALTIKLLIFTLNNSNTIKTTTLANIHFKICCNISFKILAFFLWNFKFFYLAFTNELLLLTSALITSKTYYSFRIFPLITKIKTLHNLKSGAIYNLLNYNFSLL